MAPQPLAAAPSDNRAELALQTLALLAAAASWALKGGDGELRVENTPSTPEAFQGFTVAFLAKDNSTLDESVAFASQLSKKMEELLLSSVQLELLPREEALSRICFDNCRAFASSARCSSMGLYKVPLGAGAGAFYTPAAAPVAQLSSCQVPWKLEALAPGRFKLLGPSLNLSALVPGHFAKLGAPLPLDVGIQECNAAAEAGQQTNMALQAETLQNNTLSELSTRIADAARQKSCVVVVAGPSSSGKTTFSARLALHLQARGVDARPLECDMYFKARADPTHPRDAKGELNFEDPGSLRIHKVKEDLEALMAGKPVELPKFCFKTGTIQEKTGNILQLPKQAVLIIEGIFGLHPTFLEAFGNVSLFKVLIGPWSGARLGNLCLVPERKFRLLRRIGRDVRSRGVDAARVMQKFSSVSAGEQLNIFPYAQNADVIFDSTLHYELPALRAVVGQDVENASSEDADVMWRKNELANYLSWTTAWPTSEYTLLPTSIACEFLGSSIFE